MYLRTPSSLVQRFFLQGSKISQSFYSRPFFADTTDFQSLAFSIPPSHSFIQNEVRRLRRRCRSGRHCHRRPDSSGLVLPADSCRECPDQRPIRCHRVSHRVSLVLRVHQCSQPASQSSVASRVSSPLSRGVSRSQRTCPSRRESHRWIAFL